MSDKYIYEACNIVQFCNPGGCKAYKNLKLAKGENAGCSQMCMSRSNKACKMMYEAHTRESEW